MTASVGIASPDVLSTNGGPGKSLLLVDSDARSLRVLEVTLRRAGFRVTAATSAQAAIERAQKDPPDLIILETALPDMNGFELCRRLRADPKTARASLVFLSQDDRPETKVESVNAGADEFLVKPVLVMEILSRVRIILEKRATTNITQHDRTGTLSGALANLGLVDLLQVMEQGNKSGIAYLSSDGIKSGGFVARGEERGTIYFRSGQIIDARLGKVTGPAAVYRMLLWEDGVFEIVFKTITRPDIFQMPTQKVLLEGLRRVDEWSRYAHLIPPLASKLTVDFSGLGRIYRQVPVHFRPILQLFDGKRTLFEVIYDASSDDIATLAVVAELKRNNLLMSGTGTYSTLESAPGGNVEAWLSSAPAPAPSADGPTEDVPSLLERAVIPSPQTASEILGLPPGSSSQLVRSESTLLPELLPEQLSEQLPEQRSIILSRNTVPANRAVPLTKPPETTLVDEPIPLVKTTRPPKLTVQRVTSKMNVVRPPPGSMDPTEGVEQRLSKMQMHPGAMDPTIGIDRRSAIGNRVHVHPGAMDPTLPADYAANVEDWAPVELTEPRQPVSREVLAKPEAKPRAEPREEGKAEAEAEAETVHVRPLDRDQLPNTDDLGLPGAPPRDHTDSDFNWEAPPQRHWLRNAVAMGALLAMAGAVGVLFLGGNDHQSALDQLEQKPTIGQGSALPVQPTPHGDKSDQPNNGTNGSPERAAPGETSIVPAAAKVSAPEPSPGPALGTAPAPQETAAPSSSPSPSPSPASASASNASASASASAPTPVPKGAVLAKAESALRRERFREAKQRFQAAVQADPRNSAAYSGLARVLYELTEDKGAVAAAERALSLNDREARAHLVLGLIASNRGNAAGAKQHYQQFLSLDPNSRDAPEIRRILKALE